MAEQVFNERVNAKGGLRIPKGAAAGLVATSDANGNVSWQAGGGGGGGGGVTSGELATAIATRAAKSENLADLASVAVARGNLSVYSKAEVDAATSAITATMSTETANRESADRVLREEIEAIEKGGGGAGGATASFFVSINSFKNVAGEPRGLTAGQAAIELTAHQIVSTNFTTLEYPAHGLVNGLPIVFNSLTGGTGLSVRTVYYVVGVTENTFKLALTHGGATITFTTAVTAGHAAVDSAPIVQEAAMAAASFNGQLPFKPGAKGGVFASEPGIYWVRSTRTSTNPIGYPKLKAPVSVANFNAGVHLPPGATIDDPTGNSNSLCLELGPTVWEKCIEEREGGNPEYTCCVVGVEPGTGVTQLALGRFSFGCSAPLAPYEHLKTPPPLPDGIYAGSSGVYAGNNAKAGAGFRYCRIEAANHLTVHDFQSAGWARVGYTNWGSSGNGQLGNCEHYNCVYDGNGMYAFYAESKCSITSIRIHGGWFGFSQKGAIFAKPKSGSGVGDKRAFLTGLHMQDCQFESGRGPLFYNEDGQGKIENVWVSKLQAGGSDPPMGSPNPADLYMGYPEGDNALNAYIYAGTIINVNVLDNALIPGGGWTGNAAPVTFTATLTSGSTVLTAVSSFNGLYVGAIITTPHLSNAVITELKTGTNELKVNIASSGNAVAQSVEALATQGAIVATEEIRKVDLGDSTEAINSCKFRGSQIACAPIVKDVGGTYTAKGGVTRRWTALRAAVEIGEGQLLRMSAAGTTFTCRPTDKAAGVLVGQALLPGSAGTIIPVATKDPKRPSFTTVPIANLGFGEGAAGIVPPLPRGSELKLAAALVNGTGATGTTQHGTPKTLYKVALARAVLYLTAPVGFADLPTGGGTLSTASGAVIFYRQAIKRGTETTFKATLTAGSPVLTLTAASVAGLAPGFKLTGTGMKPWSEIELVDGNTFKLTLTAAPTISGEQTLTAIAPCDTLEGALVNSSTRLTKEIPSLTALKGAGEVEVDSVAGLAPEGTIIVRTNPYSQTSTAISYTGIAGKKLTGCTAKTGGGAVLSQSVVVPLGTPQVAMHTRLYRVAQYEAPAPAQTTYQGAEFNRSAFPAELIIADGSALKSSGRVTIGNSTTLPEDEELVKTETVLKVASTATFPVQGEHGGAPGSSNRIGTIELGSNAVANLIGIQDATHFTVEWRRLSGTNKHRLKGEIVKLPPIEVAYTGISHVGAVWKLTGCTLITNTITNFIAKGATVTQLIGSEGGGVFEGAGVRYGYRGKAEARGNQYLTGVSTPGGGGELAAASTITDLTMLAVNGAGFLAGPAAMVMATKTGGEVARFRYEAAVQANGEAVPESEAGAAEEAGEEEGTGEELESTELAAAGEPIAVTYIIGISHLETAPGVEGASIGAAALYTSAPILAAEAKAEAKPTELTISRAHAEHMPAQGKIGLGVQALTYTGITIVGELGKLTGVTGWAGSVAYPVGSAVVLLPGQQVASDSAVNTAFGAGREGIGDRGVAAQGAAGDRLGVALEPDVASSVLVGWL